MLAIVVCVSLLLAGCGGSSDSSNEATGSAESTANQSDSSTTAESPDSNTTADGSDSAPQPQTAPGKTKPAVEVPESPPPKEVVVNDIEVGDGEEVKDGDKILVAFVGVNIKTGEEFESTWDAKGQSEFKMDSGELIKGWEQGIEGMKVGGRRELIVPPDLAYGKDPLVYVVDLVGIK